MKTCKDCKFYIEEDSGIDEDLLFGFCSASVPLCVRVFFAEEFGGEVNDYSMNHTSPNNPADDCSCFIYKD